LSKATSFYYQKNREHINNIIIGTGNDKTNVMSLIHEKKIMKDYDLNGKQKELLLMLKPYTDDLHKKRIELYQTGKGEHEFELHTYNELAGRLNISKDKLINWIKGKGTEKLGLEERGLVKPVKIDQTKKTSPIILYLNPQFNYLQHALTKKTYKHSDTKELFNVPYADNTAKSKFLELFIKIENKENSKEAYKHIKPFIMKNLYNLSSNKDIAKFIKKFKTEINKSLSKAL
jgi:hypothetical protein